VLFGGLDADTMVGGAGNDTLVAGGGIDLMTGGLGADVFRIVAARLPDSTFSVFSLNVTVTDFDSADRLDFTGTSGFSFVGSGAFTGLANQARLDFLTYGMMAPQVVRALLIDTDGNGFHDRYLALPGFTGDLVETGPGSRILAFAGSVVAVGTAGADTMSGGLLGDTLDGAAGNDTIIGLAGADSLVGRDGADRIFGDAGADTIIGGAGADTLTGGADADIFVYSNGTTGLGAAADVITDFQAGMGEVLNLSAIDADSVLAGNQAFVFIGSAAFSALGQVRFAGGVLQANTTGTLAADMEILLTGVVSLTAADLVL
jgi:Ca2+-binding RTX toxin-like protein